MAEVGELTGLITFVAVIQKIQTLADGGLRATLDLPETAILEAAELMAIRQAGCVVEVTIEPDMKNKQEHSGKPKLEAGSERKSEWKAAKE